MANNSIKNVPVYGSEFAALFESKLSGGFYLQGRIAAGQIMSIDGEEVTIEVGPDTRARVPTAEFGDTIHNLKIGEFIEIYADSARDNMTLSYVKARETKVWRELEKKFHSGEFIHGKIVTSISGGFIVQIGQETAFLPMSQFDLRLPTQTTHVIGMDSFFKIIKIDADEKKLIVSRRAVLEEERENERQTLVAQLNEGDIRDGKVKSFVDYGAFIDIGGFDALLHVSDMDWKRIKHPSDMLSIGDTILIKIIRINRETQRVSLSLKHLSPDPWEANSIKYEAGVRVSGVVRKIEDYGAFVELEPGIEGLLHNKEVCWGGLKIHPSKFFSLDQSIDVVVVEKDIENRRISLSSKRLTENPWDKFSRTYHVGMIFEVPVAVRDNKIRVQFLNGLEGVIEGSGRADHIAARISVGDIVRVALRNIDVEREVIEVELVQ